MTASSRAAPLSPTMRRDALITSTIPLLREHGDSVTTRQIAQACGVAEGTIFRAFPDKESLISAALRKALDPTATIAEIGAIDPALPLEDRLRAAASILYEGLTGVFALLGSMRMTPSPVASTPLSAHYRAARQAGIVDAVADLLRPDEHVLRRTPVEVAQLLRALIFSVAHPLACGDTPLGSDEIVSILLDGIRCSGSEDVRC